jgi:hypothetical protein
MIIKSISEMTRLSGKNRNTVESWIKRKDFPASWKKSGSVDKVVFLEYAAIRNEAAKKAQTGENSDIKKVILEKKSKLLDFDILKAKRDDEISKIEHEAKRGLWFSVDDLKLFASLVASAFDEAVSAVELATRDAKAVASVREQFDRVRTRLAKELEGK